MRVLASPHLIGTCNVPTMMLVPLPGNYQHPAEARPTLDGTCRAGMYEWSQIGWLAPLVSTSQGLCWLLLWVVTQVAQDIK